MNPIKMFDKFLMDHVGHIKLPVEHYDRVTVRDGIEKETFGTLSTKRDEYTWDCESASHFVFALSLYQTMSATLSKMGKSNRKAQAYINTLKSSKMMDILSANMVETKFQTMETMVSSVPNNSLIYLQYMPVWTAITWIDRAYPDVKRPFTTATCGQWVVKVRDQLYGFDWLRTEQKGYFRNMDDVSDLAERFFKSVNTDLEHFRSELAKQSDSKLEEQERDIRIIDLSKKIIQGSWTECQKNGQYFSVSIVRTIKP